MSGTEAVMQAVRLARYHTRRSHLARFGGAYHGWWGRRAAGVSATRCRRAATYTLKEMSEDSLRCCAHRRDIACVLVNPLQALHPNAAVPADSSLIDSTRRAGFDKVAYVDWLGRLRAVCTERNIVLILDEVCCTPHDARTLGRSAARHPLRSCRTARITSGRSCAVVV